MKHPYHDLPANRFWRTAVTERSIQDLHEFWTPKFHVKKDTVIVTAGSCFAQNFSKALVKRNYNWTDFEPGPDLLSPDQRRDYHYGTFSFRTGNIYTIHMLRQWLEWAFGISTPSDDVWEKGGRFFDPFRPAVEPGGFFSIEELKLSREECFAAIRDAITQGDVFVFTLGLTESWVNKTTGVEYAICPGTIAGEFDGAQHLFVNREFASIATDLDAVLNLLKEKNPNINVLLTTSPVPLTATASDKHVIVATTYSKSVLRAVAGQFSSRNGVDYFPSYEIFTTPFSRGAFYNENLRNVSQDGVDLAMDLFFREQARVFGAPDSVDKVQRKVVKVAKLDGDEPSDLDDIKCEEELLDAFGKS